MARFALAYLLVAQLLLGGAAAAQHAATGVGVTGLAEAHVLCTGGAPGSSTPDAAHDALCCLLGCTASGTQPLLDAGRVALIEPQARVRVVRFAPPAGPAADAGRDLAFEATGPPARV